MRWIRTYVQTVACCEVQVSAGTGTHNEAGLKNLRSSDSGNISGSGSGHSSSSSNSGNPPIAAGSAAGDSGFGGHTVARWTEALAATLCDHTLDWFVLDFES